MMSSDDARYQELVIMSKDDARDGRIPSLLRGSVEECNFERYYYCTFIVLLLYLLREMLLMYLVM